jgi:hypothetical protein
MPIEHEFTSTILAILSGEFGEQKAAPILEASELLGYVNEKTKSASKGSKSRGSFASLYAVYVLVEDYVAKDFVSSGQYSDYDGAKFSDLFARQRQLPFGHKLQNHALNHRMNQEFRKLFPTCQSVPILRDTATKRYWINENLLNVRHGKSSYNIAKAVLQIVDAYIAAKRGAFEGFIAQCEQIQKLSKKKPAEAKGFIAGLLKPNVDARVFEITSFAILKEHCGQESIFWGWKRDDLQQQFLMLYKTGRCNANDGGIDFVMRPLGRFFQVTETTDVKKYFLDIDKVQRYPITFVVKSEHSQKQIRQGIREQAQRVYSVKRVVKRYMDCVEEIINIPVLLDRFETIASDKRIAPVIDELVLQSRVEFNYDEP